jgi:hypothetical protein
MGLFRNWGRKNREKAAAALVKEHTRTATAQPEVASRDVAAEPPEVARRDVAAEAPQAARQEVAAEAPQAARQEVAAEAPQAARRQVAAEARPDPDKPGWGRTIGQQIGKAREDRSGDG